MTDKKAKGKTKAERFPPMKTRKGGSTTVDADGKVSKTKRKKKGKPKDTTEEKVK